MTEFTLGMHRELELESYAVAIARRCKIGSRAEIRMLMAIGDMNGDSWALNPPPEFVDEVLIALGEMGMVGVLWPDMLC